MSQKLFKKYEYDVALNEGIGAHLVTWVTGLMVFFMTLALSVNFGMATITKNWVSGLSSSLTVEIPPPMPLDSHNSPAELPHKAVEQSVGKILWLAKQHPAVESGRALPTAEVRGLIEPWLGDKMSKDLPLPALIDLKLAEGADAEKLQQDVLKLVPSASIDRHTDTLEDIRQLADTVRAFILLLTAVIVSLAVVAISGIVRAKLAIHQQEVETLHLIGASDEYIARQFRHHTLKGTLRGSAIGVVCMILTLFAISYATHTIDTAILPQLRLAPLQWAILVISPILSGALIAHMTAQRTVMRALEQLP